MKELISDHLWDGNPSYDSLSLYLNQVLVFIMGVLRTRGFIRTGETSYFVTRKPIPICYGSRAHCFIYCT